MLGRSHDYCVFAFCSLLTLYPEWKGNTTESSRLPVREWASGGSQKDECRKCFAGFKNNAQDPKSWTAIRHLVPPIAIRLLFAMLE
jgi:hypothetical protein